MNSQGLKVLLRVSTVFSIIILSLFCAQKDSGLFGAQGTSPLRSGNKVSQAADVQDAFREVFKLNQKRVVYISTEQTVAVPQNPFFNDPFFRDFFGNPNMNQPRTQKVTGLGSGFIISSEGYICTNYHVVKGVDKASVKLDSGTYNATVVGYDEITDIALLKIWTIQKLDPVYLGDSSATKVGDWAIAIGNPFGLDRTFTVGVISAMGRHDVDMMGGSQTHIQTDASINPGNSGGPLLNIYGEVIGINRMIYSQSGGSIGIGFAIPINTAKYVFEQLKQHKKVKRGYIGVQIVPLTGEYAKQLGLKSTSGALVGQVVDGSPAAKGGVQVGDVITAINGKAVKNYEDVVDMVGKTPIGQTLKMEVWRNKAKADLFITIAERP